MGSPSSTARAASDPSLAVLESESELATAGGVFRFLRYESAEGEEAFAVVMGDLSGSDPAFVRVHSECLTGEVFSSLKCDCRDQLEQALALIAGRGRGAVVYLRQEGRGIGLGNKIRAYALQEQGADTVDANLRLGFAADARQYDVATEMLADLGVASVAVLTNNPAKVDALRADGVTVTRRVPMNVVPNPHNREYLDTKRARMGHILKPL